MKVYATESVLASLVGTTRKTFRKWSWLTARADVVSIFVSHEVIIVYLVSQTLPADQMGE